MSDDTNPKDALGASKVDLSLVPPASIIHEAMAMENGAAKYGKYNWRSKQVRATVYIAAAQRHLLAFLDGEDRASDSGVHHMAHVKACAGILLDALETGNLIDDRPVKGAASRLLEPRPKGRRVALYDKARQWPVISAEQDAVADVLDAIAKTPLCGKPGCTTKEHYE